MDFKRATALFADPDFDGDPVQIYEPGHGETVVPPDTMSDDESLVLREDPPPYGNSPDTFGGDDDGGTRGCLGELFNP